MNRMRGAALLMVLWLITLLTALIGTFALSARIEGLQGRVASEGAVAGQAAHAGLEYALSRLSAADPQRRWQPDGRTYAWRFADADVKISIADVSGKIDLNAAPAPLLAGLFRTLGARSDEAMQLASAIVDWRDADAMTQAAGGAEMAEYAAAGRPYGAKNAPFDGVAELTQVLGMPPALYAQAASHLTVYSGLSRPDPRFATATVLSAMGVAPTPGLTSRGSIADAGTNSAGSGTYSIESRARLRSDRETILRAVVRIGGTGVRGAAYTTLRWEEGALPH